MFGDIAPRYDLLNHLLSMNVDRYWRWWTVRKVPLRDGGRVLDVCTGTGDLAMAYFKACGGRATVVGTDFCHEMLVLGGAKKVRLGAVGGIALVEADTLCLPFPSDHFQLVSVAFGLRNLADTDRGLAEMVRVCARGGNVVVLEFSTPHWAPLRSVYGWYLHQVLPMIGQLISRSRWNAYNYLSASVDEFPSGESLAARLLAAGLHDVRCYPLSFGIATLYVGRK
jgi:demethylmenaquinone methyltransferase/2-methoxy-6-polyprenyl-1,4-benzoquinol methylase